MLPDSVINLLVQVPLVGIFVWFVLRMQSLNTDERKSRDTEWQNFLRDQREANNAAISRLAEEIKEISKQVAAISAALQLHDQRVNASLPEMRDAVNSLRSKAT